ncbi:efflux RND transporter periplasmic adaptor subunit [Wenzhouxiangella sp. XN79A]|uniref:efflux RND transporter periplasmic adaptor subunit n=1 Tax=Wenzhouxiangella sp. XN79A TaxID=2724193 RepID=UPI00144A58CA|nr:efflux RND transporter periplasmic adaptor subunit [Wenzhouxiangella sp. XN79A]NKI35203.1 efflux RND transporter periplasmic adaptor subunit [Wenzhouxiangella sp. XN79A]
MLRPLLPALLAALLLVGCGESPEPDGAGTTDARWVLTAPVESVTRRGAQVSGTVQARFETPLAFQVTGRVQQRRVDAGQRVAAGEVLFTLDPRDFEQAARVARADLDAAEAELATAAAETRRNRDLLEREFISAQVFERVELAEASARERVQAARARLEQAENALDYATLQAPDAGTVIEVQAEPGQVVAAGAPVALLALDGPREIAVQLPEAVGEPVSGRIVGGPGRGRGLVLREVAGAADPVTRTWPARYRIEDLEDGDAAAEPRLGAVVRVDLNLDLDGPPMLQVPIGAINERGEGPQVWRIVDGRARPFQVTLIDLDPESARILADLPPDAEVIALGTHLLESGMPVKPLAVETP